MVVKWRDSFECFDDVQLGEDGRAIHHVDDVVDGLAWVSGALDCFVERFAVAGEAHFQLAWLERVSDMWPPRRAARLGHESWLGGH